MTDGRTFAGLALVCAVAGFFVVSMNSIGTPAWDNMAVGGCFELVAIVLALVSLRDR